MQAIVVDTGPLVAYFDRDDDDHAAIRAWFAARALRHRVLLTEAVVTEATHMLDFNVAVQTAFVDWAARAATVMPVPQTAYREIALWMRTYANVPMDFADATVLWLHRDVPGSRILTLDRRGFDVFRLPGSRKMPATIRL